MDLSHQANHLDAADVRNTQVHEGDVRRGAGAPEGFERLLSMVENVHLEAFFLKDLGEGAAYHFVVVDNKDRGRFHDCLRDGSQKNDFYEPIATSIPRFTLVCQIFVAK